MYGLQAINASGSRVTVSTVKTVDPATGRVLTTLDAAALATAMTPFGAAPGATLGAGSAIFILMDRN